MVKQFEESDYQDFKKWHEAWGQSTPGLDALPGYGLIKQNVAAGFVILTDAKLGILEFYISNPESKKIARDKALDEITEGLILYAKKYGCRHFMALSNLKAIGARAEKFGLKYQGQSALYFLKGH